jgi:hypothetical protein
MIKKNVTCCGKPRVLACDAKCGKAWGISRRPSRYFNPDEDIDDYVYEPDSVLGIAPPDPGTYEGGHGKPTCKEERLNKWCYRECERSVSVRPSEPIVLPDLEHPKPNKPNRQIP